MILLYFVLLLLAVVLFALHAARIGHPKVDFLALGLFFFALVPLIQTLQKL
jgi:hypothetical protein